MNAVTLRIPAAGAHHPPARHLIAAACAGALLAATARLLPPVVASRSTAQAAAPLAPAQPPRSAPDPLPWAILAPASPSAGEALQVGAFRNAASAQALRARLRHRFAHVTVTPVERDGVSLHRVRVEGLTGAGEMDAALAALRASGLGALPVTD